MRRHLIGLVLASTALASPGDKADKVPKPIDVKPVVDKLVVYRDELGNFYVTPGPDSGMSMDDAKNWVFYGDGKRMYLQRIIASSLNAGSHYEFGVWAPRVKDSNLGHLELKDGRLIAKCAIKEERPLTQLKADEAAKLFAKATFWPPLWQRTAKFLARDDDGVYYFVDELREEYGGNGHRVFVGQKGQMKELAMTNMVSDSAGQIYATKGGSLKIVFKGKDDAAYWIKGGKKVELTTLDPAANRYLVYRDLGVYGSLGTVCDDL